MHIPFFRFEYDPDAMAGIEECLRSGWLTTGAKTKEFEQAFAAYLNPERQLHAVALNSCTAALHLALEAIGLQRGELVIVPSMTFAATAEVVRYFDATPVFVDCEDDTLNISVRELARCLDALTSGKPWPGIEQPYGRIRAIIPVHYAGQPCDLDGVNQLAGVYDIAVIEDAAHAFPAGWGPPPPPLDLLLSKERKVYTGKEGKVYARKDGRSYTNVRFVGDDTSLITCFSFYANKTMTTGEGGMAVTADETLASRMRLMSLHGMNKDAWKRFTASGTWDYEIVAPGFKYNLTDIASAIGLAQLSKAERFRSGRETITEQYAEGLRDVEEIEMLANTPGVLHSRHLSVIKLRTDKLSIERAEFIDALKERGVMCSVHWRPLHMHPYYVQLYGYRSDDFPVAAGLWPRIVSLPLYPSMRDDEVRYVIDVVKKVISESRVTVSVSLT